MHDGRHHRLAMGQALHDGHQVLDSGVPPGDHAQLLRPRRKLPLHRLIPRQLLPHAPAQQRGLRPSDTARTYQTWLQSLASSAMRYANCACALE